MNYIQKIDELYDMIQNSDTEVKRATRVMIDDILVDRKLFDMMIQNGKKQEDFVIDKTYEKQNLLVEKSEEDKSIAVKLGKDFANSLGMIIKDYQKIQKEVLETYKLIVETDENEEGGLGSTGVELVVISEKSEDGSEV